MGKSAKREQDGAVSGAQQGGTLKSLILFLKVGVSALTAALFVAFLELRYVALLSPWYHEKFGTDSLALFLAVATTLGIFGMFRNLPVNKLRTFVFWSLVVGVLAIVWCFIVKWPFLDFLQEPSRTYVRHTTNALAVVAYELAYCAFAAFFTTSFILLSKTGALGKK